MVHRFSGKGLIRREPAESPHAPPRRAGPVIRNVRKIWRRDRESNPGARICSPLRHHSAIAPRCVGGGRFCGFCSAVNRGVVDCYKKCAAFLFRLSHWHALLPRHGELGHCVAMSESASEDKEREERFRRNWWGYGAGLIVAYALSVPILKFANPEALQITGFLNQRRNIFRLWGYDR
jgi:hypothetical protein